jgi:hypothetical protein
VVRGRTRLAYDPGEGIGTTPVEVGFRVGVRLSLHGDVVKNIRPDQMQVMRVQ